MKAVYFTLGLHTFCLIPIAILTSFDYLFWGVVGIVFYSFTRAAFTNPGYVLAEIATESNFSIVMTPEVKGQVLGSKTSTSNLEILPDHDSSSSRNSGEISHEDADNNSNTTSSGSEGDGEIIEAEVGEDSGSSERGDDTCKNETIVIVETRFCTVCGIDVPIRAKHCKDCGRCVHLHDHHCPWLGNCVGERNRRKFYSYLVIQTVELWWAAFLLITSFTTQGDIAVVVIANMMRGLVLFIVMLFGILVTCLFCFHSYLISANKTTWECASWSKISYLKSWPKKLGSPFSRGCTKNIRYFLCGKHLGVPMQWEIPVELPDITKKSCC